ncbi:hypothetical protein EDB83DRAFT_2553683, partial [Lactarius deliciosus]
MAVVDICAWCHLPAPAQRPWASVWQVHSHGSLDPIQRTSFLSNTSRLLRFARHQSSQRKEDLDKCIVHCTEAIFLPPVSRAGVSFNTVQLLFLLALALLERSDNYEQPTTSSIPSSISFSRKLEDGTRNIKEMVILCRELLTSNVSASLIQVVASTICLLSGAVNIEYSRGQHIQSIDEVVECLRGAVKICPPGSHEVLLVLANTLYIRFIEAGSNDDYEEATALLEIILDPNQPGGCPSSLRVIASSLAVALTHARSTIFQNPQYSEATISRLRASLDSSSIAEEASSSVTECLAMETKKNALNNTILSRGLDEANSYASQVVELSSSQSLERTGEPFPIPGAFMESYSTTRIAEKIRHLEDLLRITPPGTEHHSECLHDLADWYQSKFYRTSAISDIEESVKYSRLSADATRHSNGQTRGNSITFLRNVLFFAFNKTSNTGYLDELIAVSYDILELTSVHNTRGFQAFQWLVFSLITRFKLSGRKEDLLEVLRLIPLAIDSPYAWEPARFQLACQWAFLARAFSHPTTLTAYKTAISLMQKSLSFAPTVSIQHAHLVTLREDCQSMPLDYASFQIDFGRFEEAIEILEQGRALLWSERGFRTPLAQLTEEELPLATRFTEINRELEALTISVTPSGRPEKEDGVVQGIDRTDPFGRLVVERQRLMEERNALILQIRGQLGFEGFLKAPSFTTLRTAASRGPVILITHCKWRSDILILFHKYLPCSIPTAKDFYDRASELRDGLVAARKHGLDSCEYQDALSSVLRGLYELVGEPVIKRLRLLGVPEQSRIWWCPTSVFCSLPLHAMGPIPSRDTTDERYFSDLYIPSYTPSLSALIESRNASPQILEKPSLLLVAQPDDSLMGERRDQGHTASAQSTGRGDGSSLKRGHTL